MAGRFPSLNPGRPSYPFAPRPDGSGPRGFSGQGFGQPETVMEPGGVVQDWGRMPSNSVRPDMMGGNSRGNASWLSEYPRVINGEPEYEPMVRGVIRDLMARR